jgi:hypothetical protein
MSFATDGEHWEAALFTSGALTPKKDADVDLFIVDGGKPGKAAVNEYGTAGSGGDGGNYKTVTVHLKRGVTYQVTIGESGGASSLVGGSINANASGGSHKAGGQGADMAGGTGVNTGGEPGVYAYEKETDTVLIESLKRTLFAPGGGGGHGASSSGKSDARGGDNRGGETGGGDGGDFTNSHTGRNGTGYGAGGGGGVSISSAFDGTSYTGTGGAGGPGIIMVCDHR